MSTTITTAKLVTSSQASQLLECTALRHALRPVAKSATSPLRIASISCPRYLSTTPRNQLRDFFPAKDTPQILTTPAAWPHHGYTFEEMRAVVPAHRQPEGFADWAAWKVVRMARWCMDKATGMDRKQQVDKKNPTTAIVADKPLTEAQWVSNPYELKQLNREFTDFIFSAHPFRLSRKHRGRPRNGRRDAPPLELPQTDEARQRLD